MAADDAAAMIRRRPSRLAVDPATLAACAAIALASFALAWLAGRATDRERADAPVARALEPSRPPRLQTLEPAAPLPALRRPAPRPRPTPRPPAAASATARPSPSPTPPAPVAPVARRPPAPPPPTPVVIVGKG